MAPHPLRARFALELALGLAIAVAAGALLFRGAERPAPRRSAQDAHASGGARGAPADEVLDAALELPALISAAERAPLELRDVEAPDDRAHAAGRGQPPGTFAVEVADEEGRALAEIPLVLREEGASDVPRELRASSIPFERRVTGSSHATPGTPLASIDLDFPAEGQERHSTDAAGRAYFALAPVDAWRAATAGRTRALVIAPGSEREPSVPLPASLDERSVLRLVVPRSLAAFLQPLRARVVDGAGKARGDVPVELRVSPAGDPGQAKPLASSVTRVPGGIAVLDVARHAHLRELVDLRYRLEVALPFVQSAGVDLGASPGREDPVTIVLPLAARLAVRVEGPDGESAIDVTLTLKGRTPARASEEDWRDWPVLHARDGRAVFAPIGLGLELRLTASRRDGSSLPEPLVFAGPTRAGETREVVLRLMTREAQLAAQGVVTRVTTGRVVDEAGQPLAGAQVSLTTTGVPGGKIVQRIGTDRDGRFQLETGTLAGTAELQAAKPGFVPTSRTVDLGSTVVVELPREACFMARILVEDPIREVDLVAWLRGGTDVSLGRVSLADVHASLGGIRPGQFRGCEIRPGEYALEISQAHCSVVLERIEGIRLEASEGPAEGGEPLTDPRLDPLDLRGRWIVSTFHLRGDAGRPIASMVQVAIDGRTGRAATSQGGSLELVTRPGALIEITPFGHAPQRRLAGGGDEQIFFAREE